jgi:6-phosphogluconate dehydrogenase
MEIGFVGLGKMGMNMVERLRRDNHKIVAFDLEAEKLEEVSTFGADGVDSLKAMVARLKAPRGVWVMVPAGEPTETTINQLAELLEPDDTIIDGGNTNFYDDVRRAGELAKKKLHLVDAGTSGGIWGLKVGYCLMIGGEQEIFRRYEPIFKTLAPVDGYGYMGGSGAGHYVKMVHNGIEYGIMAAYAEGMNILKNANVGKQTHAVDAETTPLRNPKLYQYDFNLTDVAEVWRRGSVIASWLLDLTADALLGDPELKKFAGRVSDSGEGRWTIDAAIDEGVPAHVLTTALYERFSSRGNAEFADKLLSAMRYEFGGHIEKKS